MCVECVGQIIPVPFEPLLSSLDRLSTDSNPQQRYKDIVRERYLISKHTNTSYTDTEDMAPIEREYILEFIMEELQRQKELMDEAKAKAEANRK